MTDRAQEAPSKREFIGTVRYRLFIQEPHEWNGIVRDITAQLERDETVNAEIVCIYLAEFYRSRAHWARFKQSIQEGENNVN